MNPRGLFNQSITVYPKSAYNRYARAVFGEGSAYNARIQKGQKNKLLPNGQVITIEAVAYVDSKLTLNINDKLTYASDDYKIWSKNDCVDGQGNVNHYKLELIKWLET